MKNIKKYNSFSDKLSHVKMYENFDLDKFMEDPSGNIHDDDNPEIEIGDWTTSYRGVGQVMDLPKSGEGLATVQLVDSPKSIIKVPSDKLTKIKKEEAEKAINRIPDTVREIEKLSSEIEGYLEVIGAYESDDIYLPDVDLAIELLEDMIIEIIDLKKKDPYLVYHKEYSSIIFGFSTLADAIKNSTEDRRILDRLQRIEDNFEDISG